MMKKVLPILLALIFIISCKSYTMKTELNENFSLKQIKSSGIILRLSSTGIIKRDTISQNMNYWLESYDKIKNIGFQNNISDRLGLFNPETNRFYQKSINSSFLKFKSLGVINTYLRRNSLEIKKLMIENGYDSLVLFEVDMGYSVEAQFIDFDSMVVVIDKELNAIYMNHQKDSYNIDTFDSTLIKKHLLDKVAIRFIRSLEETGHIKFSNKKKKTVKKDTADKK